MSYLFKFGNKIVGVRRQKQESWDPNYQEQITEELPPQDEDSIDMTQEAEENEEVIVQEEINEED
jgi:hypothetical protein